MSIEIQSNPASNTRGPSSKVWHVFFLLGALAPIAAGFRQEARRAARSLAPASLETQNGTQGATIDSYLALTRHARYIEQNMDPEDARILQRAADVERDPADSVVLYHALSPIVYVLAQVLRGVESKTPIATFQSGGTDALGIAFRAFMEGHQFPEVAVPDVEVRSPVILGSRVRSAEKGDGNITGAVHAHWSGRAKVVVKFDSGSEESFDVAADEPFPLQYVESLVSKKFASALSETELAAAGVHTAGDFVRYAQDHGAFDRSATGVVADHLAGIRERVMSVNVNLFGSWPEGWAESSWDIFRDLRDWDLYGRAGDIPFLTQILKKTHATPDVKKIVEQQLDLMGCLWNKRLQLQNYGCREAEQNLSKVFSCASTEKAIAVFRQGAPALTGCKKAIGGKGWVGKSLDPDGAHKCGTGILLQLFIPASRANDFVYASTAGGVPISSPQSPNNFLDLYRKVKNTPAGDDIQARVLLSRDLSITAVAHGSLFMDDLLLDAFAALADDIRGSLMGERTSCLDDQVKLHERHAGRTKQAKDEHNDATTSYHLSAILMALSFAVTM